MNSYDIDGVVFINKDIDGVYPGPADIIITGRSFQESPETYKMLHERKISNAVFFNPLYFYEKTRESSGQHKADTLNSLHRKGLDIKIHFDDDEIQINIIKSQCPWLEVIYLQHNLTTKENVRHNDET